MVCNSSNSDYIKLLAVSVLVLLVYGAGPRRPQPQQSLSLHVPLCAAHTLRRHHDHSIIAPAATNEPGAHLLSVRFKVDALLQSCFVLLWRWDYQYEAFSFAETCCHSLGDEAAANCPNRYHSASRSVQHTLLRRHHNHSYHCYYGHTIQSRRTTRACARSARKRNP